MMVLDIKAIFSLPESSCESGITMDSVGSNVTITIDPPTCPGWEHPNNLEYEAFLVYRETNKTVKIAPISGVNSYKLGGISYGLYEFVLNATNSCWEQCTLVRKKFYVPGSLIYVKKIILLCGILHNQPWT